MKWRAALRSFIFLSAVLLSGSINFAGHIRAMEEAMGAPSAETRGMNHGPGGANPCPALCGSAVVSREETASNYQENEDDDEPVPPPYAHRQQWQSDTKTQKRELYAGAVKPPPKIPVYIIYGVFRA